MCKYKKFVSNFFDETVFLQAQGHFSGDYVDGGVCAALSYLWASENLDGTFDLNKWRPRESRFKFSGVPVDSGIAARFPDLAMPTIHAQKVKSGALFLQKSYQIEFKTSPDDSMEKIGKNDKRTVKCVWSMKGSFGASDVTDYLRRNQASFLNGYGILTFSMKKGAHAVAFQANRDVYQWYDCNFGHFKSISWLRMRELIEAIFFMANYDCKDLKFYSLHRK